MTKARNNHQRKIQNYFLVTTYLLTGVRVIWSSTSCCFPCFSFLFAPPLFLLVIITGHFLVYNMTKFYILTVIIWGFIVHVHIDGFMFWLLINQHTSSRRATYMIKLILPWLFWLELLSELRVSKLESSLQDLCGLLMWTTFHVLPTSSFDVTSVRK